MKPKTRTGGQGPSAACLSVPYHVTETAAPSPNPSVKLTKTKDKTKEVWYPFMRLEEPMASVHVRHKNEEKPSECSIPTTMSSFLQREMLSST